MSFTVTYANPKKFSIIRLTPYLGIQGQYVVFTDGAATWRKGVRYSYFVLDKALTALGFSGDENTDWENVRELGSMKLGFGPLYNWYAATYNTGGASIAPAGWHVPTSDEWLILINYLIASGFGYGGSGNDIAKSVASTSGWIADTTPGNAGNDLATNNISGFNIRPIGVRSPIGVYWGLHNFSYFWSSTDDAPLNILTYGIQAYANTFAASHYDANGGEPIRLIQNDDVDPGTLTDYDGNVYPTIKLGTQVWMASNLAVTHYNDGTVIPEVTDDTLWAALTTGALCVYNNDWNNI